MLKHIDKIFWGVLLFVSFVKLYWATSREIFSSGPDADTYTAMARDIVDLGFFSSELTGVPVWSQGYSTFLAGLIELFGENYAVVAQVIQISLFSLSIELFRRISISLFSLSDRRSYIYGSALALQPAGFFYPQQAMYEAILVPLLSIFLFGFLGKRNTNIFAGVYTSFAMAGLLVVHQRTLPIVVLAVFILRNQIPRFFWQGAFISSPLIFLFIVRNGIYYGSWTLTAAGDGVFTGISRLFSGRFSEFLVNFSYFWTSYSGYSKRGTWYHNVTVQFLLDDWLAGNTLMILGFLGCFLVFTFVAAGSLEVFRKNKQVFWFSLSIIVIANFIDGVTFGDSRHRLIFVPILLALAMNSEKLILKKIGVKNLQTKSS